MMSEATSSLPSVTACESTFLSITGNFCFQPVRFLTLRCPKICVKFSRLTFSVMYSASPAIPAIAMACPSPYPCSCMLNAVCEAAEDARINVVAGTPITLSAMVMALSPMLSAIWYAFMRFSAFFCATSSSLYFSSIFFSTLVFSPSVIAFRITVGSIASE